MGHRRASREVNKLKGAGAAALLLLLGACGGAAEDPGVSTAPTGTTPGASTPGATLPGTTPGAAGAAAPGAVKPTTTAPTTTTPGVGTPNTPGVGTPGVGQTQPDGAAAGSILPCNVTKIMAKNCASCHGAMPIGGAPMPLVTFADFQAPGKTNPAKKVHELVKERIHDMARPMPPTSVAPMPAEEIAAMDTWFTGGALAGTAEDAACVVEPGAGKPTGGSPGEGDGGIGRIVPKNGEVCYEFKVHGGQTLDDTKFMMRPGELYEQFYYKVPWPADMVATGYATIADNAQVLHHWLLFSTNEAQQEGAHFEAPLPTLIGTDPILLAGWAVGGPNLVMPDDVGMELPNPGRTMNVQWHFYNSTDQPQADASLVQICTVPAASRPNHGSITWMGTEDLNGNVWAGGPGMPAGKESTFTTSCRPGRGDAPINIMGFEPHMHRIGKNMKTSVIHVGGQKEVIFDKPFVFGSETHYFKDYLLAPGETLETSCTFMNDNNFGVPFGESSDTEMCYQFTFHYPAHALSNGAFSILGVTDTCW